MLVCDGFSVSLKIYRVCRWSSWISEGKGGPGVSLAVIRDLRGSGPRDRMVPLINSAGATLRWFIQDVWSCFDDDHARPGVKV